MENKVVIFSNGIADFQQTYRVSSEKECKVSIPVKHNHIADVLGSFNVYGNVRLASPPTFTPENNRYGALSIDSSRVYEDMATKLSGAQVIVSHAGGTIEGQLIGVQKEPEGTNGDPITPYSVVVMTETGLQRCKINDIANMEFLEKEVRTEIDKVLQEKLRAIKPNSTFVDFVLTTEENSTEAVVQYTLPVAAWKISYRFHLGEDNKATLQGFAIVDNSTEQDWKDYKVCVVTGMPITFSTDIASSKTPRREHVDLVAESAIGAVYVDEDEIFADSPPTDAMRAAPGAGGAAQMIGQGTAFKKARSVFASDTKPLARTSEAEIQEVGDFCVFESIGNVDIPANRSSVIPVFNADLDSVVPVLHYAMANQKDRPFRAIDFVNGTGHSLGSGVCIVYDQGLYSGSCVMPAMKPNEQRLLSHALETGVKVECKLKQTVTKRTAVVLEEGFCHLKFLKTRDTEYKIKNSQSNAFKFYLDHIQFLRESELKCTLVVDGEKSEIEPYSKISGGVRFNVQLPANANASIKVHEKSLSAEKVELIVKSNRKEQAKIDWLVANVIDSDVPIKLGPEVQQIKKLLASLRETRDQVAKLAETSNQVNEKQERLRKNIKTAGKDELTKKWIKELDEAEKQIQSIDEKKIPALRLKEDEIHQQIVDLIRSISAEWIDENG